MAFGTPKVTNVEQVVDKNPDLYMKRAEQAIRNGNVNEALMECDAAIEYSHGGSHYVFEKVKILNHSGLFRECLKLIQGHIYKFHTEMNLQKLGEVYMYVYCSYQSMKFKHHGEYFVASYQSHHNSLKRGFGVYLYPNGDVYVGDWKNAKRNGFGMLLSQAVLKYEGKWDHDKPYNLARIVIRRLMKIVVLSILIFASVTYFDDAKNWVSEFVFGSGEDSQTEEGYSRYLSLTTEAANIREFPSLTAPILAQVSSSQQVLYLEKDEVDEEGRTWYRVRDEYGNEGWLSSSIVADMDNVDTSDRDDEEFDNASSNSDYEESETASNSDYQESANTSNSNDEEFDNALISDYKESENASINQVNEEDIAQFIYAFRESYMHSLNDKDISLVAPYLVYQSSIYRDIEEYISSLGPEYFQFYDLSILSIEEHGNKRYTVKTYETFNLTDNEGQVTYNERDKTYTLYAQGESSFVIENIEITSTHSN